MLDFQYNLKTEIDGKKILKNEFWSKLFTLINVFPKNLIWLIKMQNAKKLVVSFNIVDILKAPFDAFL